MRRALSIALCLLAVSAFANWRGAFDDAYFARRAVVEDKQYALEFYGSTNGGHVTLPDSTFPTGGNPKTISIWVKKDGVVDNSKRNALWSVGPYATRQQLTMFWDSAFDGAGNNNKLLVGDDTSYGLFSTSAFSTGVWHNAVLTYTNGLMSLFVNMTAQGTHSHTENTTNTYAYIGAGPYNSGSPRNIMGGQLDEMIVWNRALSTTEIGNVYSNRGAIPASVTNGIIAKFLMDEGSGTNVNDTSGSGKNGVLIPNGAWMQYP